MTLKDLQREYDKLQFKYGDSNLDAIYGGGCTNNPDICFVFMNPTARNIASSKTWKGLKYPWIGTKNIWTLFYNIGLLDEGVYTKIRSIKGSEWSEAFAREVYNSVSSHKYYITNLAKCTQVDARSLDNYVFDAYLDLFLKEIEIINPKVIILFGNQVSSVVLKRNISVSMVRKVAFNQSINGKTYKFYSVYYPVGNGIFNIEKAIEDIKWIISHKIS